MATKFKVLRRRVEQLLGAHSVDPHYFPLKDQTRVVMTFAQISKGSAEVIQKVRSYEAYVMGNAVRRLPARRPARWRAR